MNPEDDKYVKALLSNNRVGIKAIYDEYLPRIEVIIGKMGGSKDDAWEIFQESLIVVMTKAQKPDFKLTSSFYTYLVSVCKFKWFNEAKKKYKKNITIEGQETLSTDDDILDDIHQVQRYRLYREKLGLMDSLCRQILELFFNHNSLKDITEKLNLKNENAVKQRKYQCQKKLIAMIQSDPAYKELL